ncbi:MAG: MotA/TolQ/ExbB proton channel family protein [Cyclobacteriaceae bacterium]
MIDLFVMGGPLFMSLITITFFSAIVVAIRAALTINKGQTDETELHHRIGLVKSIGLLALVLGVLGQTIGLFSAFEAIEQMGSVSPAMLAGGLKVSSITTIYGLVCYVLSLLMYFGLTAYSNK